MKNGYAGRISNAGSQKVTAPNGQTGDPGKTTVKTGEDLRSNSGRK